VGKSLDIKVQGNREGGTPWLTQDSAGNDGARAFVEYIVTETGTAVHLLAHPPLPSRSNIYFLTNV